MLGTEPRRPARRDQRPRQGRPRRSAATRRRCRTWSPTCASGHRLVRGRGRGARAGDRASCPDFLAAGEPTFANLNALVPARCAPSRARRCPGVRTSPGDAARRDCRSLEQVRGAGVRARAARPRRRPAADDPEARAARRGATLAVHSSRRGALVAASTRSIIPWSHSTRRAGRPATVPARRRRAGLRGDRLRAHRDRRREPLRRRQRPAPARARRQRHEPRPLPAAVRPRRELQDASA